jgi:hypothetical protein
LKPALLERSPRGGEGLAAAAIVTVPNIRLRLTTSRESYSHSGRAESPLVRYLRQLGSVIVGVPSAFVRISAVTSARDSARPERARDRK